MTEPFTVHPARYAKRMMAVRVHDSVDGFKGRASYLCCALKMRWSNRERAYITSPSKAKKLQKLYTEGYDATMLGRIYHPKEFT